MGNIYINNKAYDPNTVFLRYPRDGYYGEGEPETTRKQLQALDTDGDSLVTYTEAGKKPLEFLILSRKPLVSTYFAKDLKEAQAKLALDLEQARLEREKIENRGFRGHIM